MKFSDTENQRAEALRGMIGQNPFSLSPSYRANLSPIDFMGALRPYTLNTDGYRDELDNDELLAIITPAFQRANTKWTKAMQIAFIENILAGMPSTIYLYSIGDKSMKGCYAACHILDGLQRTTALKEFAEGKFSVYGDFTAQDAKNAGYEFGRTSLTISYFHFADHVEACRHYIAMNKNITHNEEDLKTAYAFLAKQDGAQK